MTNEEAIKILKSKMDGSVDTSYEWAETVRMAINALTAQPETHEERTETHACDLIDRQAAIDAVRELYIQSPKINNDIAYDMAIDQAHDALINLPSAQPVAKDINVPIKDCISRQAAIDALFELYEYQRDIDPTEAADLVRQGIFLAEKKIEKLPSAQPEPEPVGCSGCRYERFGNRVCDVCSRFYVDRYEAERRTDEQDD